MYFALSGMFFKDYGGFILTTIKKINKLILPYCLFFAFGVATNIALSFCFSEEIHPRLLTFFTGDIIAPNVGLWFLRSLFTDNLIFFCICQASKNNRSRVLCCILLGLCGYILNLNDLRLPWHFSVSLSSMPFFGFGYILRTSGFFNTMKKLKSVRLLLILCSATFITIIARINGIPGVGWFINRFNEPAYLYYLVSIVMVTGFLLVLQLIGRVPGLSYIGRYSIVPFGVHYPILVCIRKVVAVYGMQDNHALIFAVTLAISVALIPVFTRLFPHFTAQKDLIHINPEGQWFFRRIKFAM